MPIVPSGKGPIAVPSLDELPEGASAIVADREGAVLHASDGSEDAAAAVASAIREIEAAGEALGLAGLHTVSVRGTTVSTVAVRDAGLLFARAAPGPAAGALEKALERWSLPQSEAPARESWASLRDALVRGRIADAIVHWREIAAAPPLREARAGSEPLHREELDVALDSLLCGIVAALAHDALGSLRLLQQLAAPSQRNLSIRWLALHFCSRAALEASDVAAAARHARDAVALSAQLDDAARAVSHWTAAEALALEVGPEQASEPLAQACETFTRIGDGWGLARARLAQARILASGGREADAGAVAAQAAEADASWDEPHLFRARRLLLRGDVASAEHVLAPLRTRGAQRERALVEALRRQLLTIAQLGEFVVARDAQPTSSTIEALKRISAAAPAFAHAREALAQMLLRLGRYDEAKATFDEILATEPGAAERSSLFAAMSGVAVARRLANRPAAAKPRPAPQAQVARPDPAGQIMLRGNLAVMALFDVFELLRMGRRSGVLACTSAKGTVKLRFSEGFIADALSSASPDVVELLVRSGELPEQALRTFAQQRTGSSGRTVGEVLVRKGLVAGAALRPALERHIALAVRELLRWESGEFLFDRVDGVAKNELDSAIDPQRLLLELTTESDEASRDESSDG
jgi:tetratricopeptide (TPR) repeat protein